METKDNETVLEAAEKEITSIVNKRFPTIFEQRMKTLTEDVLKTQTEAAVNNMGHSGPYIEKWIELRIQAIRDIVLDRFNIFKELHSQYNIPWTDSSLKATGKDLEEWVEGKFTAEREATQEQVCRAFKPGDRIVEWALKKVDRERDFLSGEVARGIEVLRSEGRLKEMTAGRNPDQTPTIQINISGGQVGVVNAGTIHTIQQNLSGISEAGGKDFVDAIKALTEGVINSKELREDQIKEAVDGLEFLSRQASIPPDKRTKGVVVSSVLDRLQSLVSTTATISQLWTAWSGKLKPFLKLLGILEPTD